MTDTKKDNLNIKDNQSPSLRYDPVIFNSDHSLYVLHRRIENMTSAVFLVTNSISENDMLRMSLRKTCLKALEDTMSFIGNPQNNISFIQVLISHVLEIHSLLNITFWSGLISEMNAGILQREVTKIQEIMTELLRKYKNKLLIDPALFTPLDLEVRHHRNSMVESRPKFEEKPQEKRTLPQSNPTPIKREIVSDNKAVRRQSILNLLAERTNVSIKDFTTVIPLYSEKTIQRELIALVAEGLVKKEGERRWSTYSLAR